jgi:ATP-dependent DNA helicase RecG
MNLDDKIIENFRTVESQRKALGRLKIETIQDLLYHFPTRYGDKYDVVRIKNLQPKSGATVYGRIKKIDLKKTYKSRVAISEATIEDDTGKIKAIWFNQPYIAKMFQKDDLVSLTGEIGETKSKTLTINNPKIEKVESIQVGSSDSLFNTEDNDFLSPVYKESKGITSNWIYYTIQKIIKSDLFEKLEEPIPENILEKYNLPKLKTALIWIHSPKKERDALSARKRFAFEEIFYIQLKKQIQRQQAKSLDSYIIDDAGDSIKDFLSRFPFDLTESQQKAVDTILEDIQTPEPMSRLLEGDVGSGKTVVSAAAVYAVTKTSPKDHKFGRLQTAYMVPTEILAKQHFENFIKYFENTGVQIGLMTGSGCYKFPSKVSPTEATKISRAQLLKWIESGDIPILIGTHSLIQKTIKFKNLALVIIDEQHRFGTEQRKKLAQKEDFAPHLLSMTATPIPRTLALTIYGDLDLSIIDQMPLGRKPVITDIVLKNERDETYEKIRKEIKNGRQAYVICPRIDEPDPDKQNTLNVKSVKTEVKYLQEKIFPELKIGMIHGKMKPVEKDSIMKEFEDGGIDILVSTSVIEVGVNVPNSTMIIIEGAERFGLAQLHQLRGRVIRSNHQAYCYIFTESNTQKTIDRLQALKTSKNGFELSEHDLQLRGSGELAGNKQWGISDIGMEAIKNIKMVEAAREESNKLITKEFKKINPLKNFPTLKKKLESKRDIHFE